MARWTPEQEAARQQLIEAIGAWRNAECFDRNGRDGNCDGDNHGEECPVEMARQDILAASNKVDMLHAG